MRYTRNLRTNGENAERLRLFCMSKSSSSNSFRRFYEMSGTESIFCKIIFGKICQHSKAIETGYQHSEQKWVFFYGKWSKSSYSRKNVNHKVTDESER